MGLGSVRRQRCRRCGRDCGRAVGYARRLSCCQQNAGTFAGRFTPGDVVRFPLLGPLLPLVFRSGVAVAAHPAGAIGGTGMIDRRGFLSAMLLALTAAPAIVRASSLMPVRVLTPVVDWFAAYDDVILRA